MKLTCAMLITMINKSLGLLIAMIDKALRPWGRWLDSVPWKARQWGRIVSTAHTCTHF